MAKDRLAAFMDAILAIIMTILVLELEQPINMTWNSILELWPNYLAYALSFFWIGTMWVNLHYTWHFIDKISNKSVWWSIVLLFITSFFPYVTKMVSSNFQSQLAHLVYAIVVFGVTLTFIPLAYVLSKENKGIKGLEMQKKWYITDVTLKIIGLLLTLLGFTQGFMLAMLIAMIISTSSSFRKVLKF